MWCFFFFLSLPLLSFSSWRPGEDREEELKHFLAERAPNTTQAEILRVTATKVASPVGKSPCAVRGSDEY